MFNNESKSANKFQPSLYDALIWMNRKVAFKGGKSSQANKEAQPVLRKIEVK